MRIQKPTIGRIVVYRDSARTDNAAIITRTYDPEDCDGACFVDVLVFASSLFVKGTTRVERVPYVDPARRRGVTWHYPERCDETIEVTE